MLRACLLAVVVSVSLSPTVFAVAPPPSARTVALGRLIEQLGARDPRARNLAERRLLDAGPAAVPRVRLALSHRDREIRRRALRLLPALEEAVLFAPRRVTF